MTSKPGSKLKIAVVGACAAGKSTLVSSLQEEGYEAHHVAQEHSYVPNMWQRIGRPDVLIYLDVNYESIKARRPHLDFRPEHLAEQNHRLAHARQYCQLYLDTNELSISQVRDQTLAFLEQVRPK
jgi:deoxyadenosine/deoxycytidine kinase